MKLLFGKLKEKWTGRSREKCNVKQFVESDRRKGSNRKPRYIVACATLSLIATIMMFVLGIITIAMINEIEEHTAYRINQLHEQQFYEIWELVTTYQHSAYLLMYYHAQLAYHNLMIEAAIEDGVIAVSYRQAVFIALFAFWIVFVAVISAVQNNMANKIEMDYLRRMLSST